MALTEEQRGPRASWLRKHRLAKFGSGEGGLAKLSAALKRLGLDRSTATIKGWESSDERSPIPPDALPYLEELFGEPAPRPVVAATPGEMVAALRDQTAALTALAEEIRLSRAEEAVTRQEMMRALAALAGGRALPGTPAGVGRGTPEGALP